jgi:pimeloyl-ACP methyl ester carboxylesterase
MERTQEGFVEVEAEVRLYFRSVGAGQAVLIPLVSWMEDFAVLSKGRRLIFYDPRNRGQSSAVELERISFANDVRDVEAVRRHFALEKVALIGWSYFGGVVAQYATGFEPIRTAAASVIERCRDERHRREVKLEPFLRPPRQRSTPE